MTCRDMGGVCDAAMTAATAEEMMKMGGDHVMAATDPEHMKLQETMKAAMADKTQMDAWTADFMTKWDAAPETDAAAPMAA